MIEVNSTMKLHKIVKEEKDLTLKDIEKGYGKKVAQALVRYCTLKKLDMDEVVGDLKTDGNGMTPWDKFDVWAQNTLGLDIMGDFDDTYDWSGAEERERQQRELDRQEKEDKPKRKRKHRRIKTRSRYGREYPFDDDSKRFTEKSLMNESSFEKMTMKDVLDAFSKNQNYDLEMDGSGNTIYVTNINDDQHYVLTIRHID